MAEGLTPDQFRSIVREVIDDRFNGTIEAMKRVARMEPDIRSVVELRVPLTQLAAAAQDLFSTVDYATARRKKENRRRIMWQELSGFVSWARVPGSWLRLILIAAASAALVHWIERGGNW